MGQMLMETCKSSTEKPCFLLQALEAVEQALACNPDNIEMQRKARDLQKKMGMGASQTKAGKENQTSQQQATGESEGSSQTQKPQSLKVFPVTKRFTASSDPAPQDLTSVHSACMTCNHCFVYWLKHARTP